MEAYFTIRAYNFSITARLHLPNGRIIRADIFTHKPSTFETIPGNNYEFSKEVDLKEVPRRVVTILEI